MIAAARVDLPDAKRDVRMRRFILAASAYSVCVPLLLLAQKLGLVSLEVSIATGVAMLLANAVLFLVFHTRLNERFRDPSLTWVQVILATVILMFVVYHLDRERGLVLMLCLVVLSFGAFRFDTREFLNAAGIVLAGYALVINVLMWRKAEAVDVPLEAFRWTLLAFVLPCFAVVVGRISELRHRLQRTNGELSRAVETIHQIATHDALTGLPNRTLFNETLAHALGLAERHERPLALFFLDLDRFKHINDTLGHGVGDRVLQEISRRLRGAVRSSDFVARLGGDEFVILIEEFADTADLAEIAAKVIAALEPTFTVDGHELILSASIGACTYPADGANSQELLSNADIAMYRAKEQGRNRFCFYAAALNTLSPGRLSLEAGLHHALSRNEIEVFYQPKIAFAGGKVTGVEALIRWRHPQLGLLLPDRFVPLAEETGAIIPIGYWTLRQVCGRIREWRRQGLLLPVAVNLGASQFHEPRLVPELEAILRDTGVAAEFLEIEITESMVMRDPERAGVVMAALRERGVRLSIDDFGTGHSSLGYLKRFPIDRLKVDRTFVRDLPHNDGDVAITRAVIAMAHSLGMTVVAEGVEHQEQFDLLRAEGCDEFQGYLCTPPLPEGDLVRFLEEAQVPA